MKRTTVFSMAVLALTFLFFSVSAFGDYIELAKKSTIEEILKRGELRVG